MSEEVKGSISGFNSAFSKILLKCVRNTNHKHILKLYILFTFENVATNIDRQKNKRYWNRIILLSVLDKNVVFNSLVKFQYS